MTNSSKIKILRGTSSQMEFGRKIWPEDTDAAVQSRIKRLEADDRELTASDIVAISRACNISIFELLGVEEAPSGFTLVPKYRTRLSGGPGSYVLAEDVEREFAFRTEWLKRKVGANNCALFEVEGNSMFPVISDGDIVLVDRSVRSLDQVTDRKIYAYAEDDRVKVKRLEKRGIVWWSISESGDSYELNFDAEIYTLIGKVIWVGHEIK